MSVTSDSLYLNAFFWSARIPKDRITKIILVSAIFQQILKIEHDLKGCPPFLTFRTDKLKMLTNSMADKGYIVS